MNNNLYQMYQVTREMKSGTKQIQDPKEKRALLRIRQPTIRQTTIRQGHIPKTSNHQGLIRQTFNPQVLEQ